MARPILVTAVPFGVYSQVWIARQIPDKQYAVEISHDDFLLSGVYIFVVRFSHSDEQKSIPNL